MAFCTSTHLSTTRLFLKNEIRWQCSKIPFFYRSTYGLKPKNRRLLPKAYTSFLIDGAPRSGNTYAASIIEVMLPHIHFSHHQHNFANILFASSLRIPILILYRNPRQSILSNLVRDPFLFPPQAARHWISYYKHLLKLPHIHFLAFEQLCSRPVSSLNKFFTSASLQYQIPPIDDRLGNAIAEHQRSIDDVEEGLSNVHRSSMPTSEKVAISEQYSLLLDSLPNKYQRAFDVVYGDLCARSLVLTDG